MALTSIGINHKLMPKELLQRDLWLSEVIEKNAYRLVLGSEPFDLKIPPGPCFIYCKTAVDDLKNFTLLREWGFDLVDTHVVFEKTMGCHCEPNMASVALSFRNDDREVRFAVPLDVEQVVLVARSSFVYSRFHLDPKFQKSVADKVKAEWVRNFFLGKRGSSMIVAEVGQIIAGFLLLIEEKNQLVIDLIAVSQEFQGQGLASQMIGFAEGLHFPVIRVGTQLANQPSLELYQKLQFKLVGAQYVFHFHGEVP